MLRKKQTRKKNLFKPHFMFCTRINHENEMVGIIRRN